MVSVRRAAVSLLAALFVACGGATALPIGGDAGAPGDDASVADGSSGDASAGDASLAPLEACEGPGTCILGAAGCCGLTCGYSSVAELVAIEWQRASALQAATCSGGQPPCPGCDQALDPNWQAFCRGNVCQGIDVRMDSVSTCAQDSDCAIRAATCCEPCTAPSASEVVAIAKSAFGEFASQVCLPTEGACPRCAPMYPANLKATCDPTTRHCRVTKG